MCLGKEYKRMVTRRKKCLRESRPPAELASWQQSSVKPVLPGGRPRAKESSAKCGNPRDWEIKEKQISIWVELYNWQYCHRNYLTPSSCQHPCEEDRTLFFISFINKKLTGLEYLWGCAAAGFEADCGLLTCSSVSSIEMRWVGWSVWAQARAEGWADGRRNVSALWCSLQQCKGSRQGEPLSCVQIQNQHTWSPGTL